MNAKLVRLLVAAAVAASAMVGVTPSHAGVDGGWVVIGTGAVEIGGGPDPGPIIDTIMGIVANVGGGHGKPCVPSYSSVSPGGLSWTVWRNDYTLQLAVEWHGPGYAAVSADCADKLSIAVQVNDYAANGNPVASGNPASATDDIPSSGQFNVSARSDDWVEYYDPPNLYARGNTVVELKVSASYFNPKGKVWVPIGCKVTHTSVRAWPDGSVDASTAPMEDCAA